MVKIRDQVSENDANAFFMTQRQEKKAATHFPFGWKATR